jgi:predicted transglutaminase-like cysteine proteinase
LTRRGLITAFAALQCLLVATTAPRPAAAQTLADLVQTSKQAQGGGALFGSVELKSNSLKGLPQWTRVLGAVTMERKAFDDCAANANLCTSPILKTWRRIITTAAALPRGKRIKAVNDFFNRWPYKQDRELYGVSEYWATPKEFMARSGDCEDYSIAKYFALRKLGFKKEELRVVILMDTIRGIGHAVLAFYAEDRILILDSLSNLILPHSRYKHYVPQYSMNETTRWAHIGGFKKKKNDAYRGLLAKKPK